MDQTSAEIKADLDAFRAARRALITGAQSYMIDSGGGKKQVTRADLDSLNATIDNLARDYEAALDDENGGSGWGTPIVRFGS